MAQRAPVARFGNVQSGTCATAGVVGKKILIYDVDGSFYATSNTCGHHEEVAGDVLFDGSEETCPWHAWRFEVSTGEAVFEHGVKIDGYRVHVDRNDILVEV